MATDVLGISSVKVLVVEVFKNRPLPTRYGSVSLLALTTRDPNTQVQVMTFKVDLRRLPDL